MRETVPMDRRAWMSSCILVLALVGGCPRGDVGAPCNHGSLEPPQSDVVTFPSLRCNDLLCVYADATDPPARACTQDADCNEGDPGTTRFECFEGACRLELGYVLERSMCSKRCSSDADCDDREQAKDHACSTGFTCTAFQTLGPWCCEKLCVCRDDLEEATVSDITDACEAGTQEGCCTDLPLGVDAPAAACGQTSSH
jgi:hypothetical protein